MNTLTALPRALTRARTTTITPLIFTRSEATSRRLTKKLRLPPHPSMVVGGHGGAAAAASPEESHIVHNPPSAAPSAHATPNLFLPAGDPRRDIFSAFGAVRETELPPPLRRPRVKRYHLSLEQIDEIRRLRAENPGEWSRKRLAERFDTSPFFVGMVAEASQQRKEEMQGRLATIKSRWGTIRTTARFERTRRRSGWGGADGQ